MTKLGLCEDMSMSWNRGRILKKIRSYIKGGYKWKEAKWLVRGEIMTLMLIWENDTKLLLLIRWIEELGKNGD